MGSEVVEGCSVQTLSIGPRLELGGLPGCFGGWVQRSWRDALSKHFQLVLVYSWVACQAALVDGFRGRGEMLCPNTFTWSSSIVGWLARLLWWMGSEVMDALSKHFQLVLVYSWVACQATLVDGFRGRGGMLCPNTFNWSSSRVGWLARLLWWMGSEVVERCSVQTLSLGPRL